MFTYIMPQQFIIKPLHLSDFSFAIFVLLGNSQNLSHEQESREEFDIYFNKYKVHILVHPQLSANLS